MTKQHKACGVKSNGSRKMILDFSPESPSETLSVLYFYFWSFAAESIVLIAKADWYFTSAPKLAVCVCVCVYVHAAHTACSWHRQQQACLQRFPSTPSTPNKTESLPQVEWYNFAKLQKILCCFRVNLFILVFAHFVVVPYSVAGVLACIELDLRWTS